MSKPKQLNRVPIDVSIHWRFLHQDMGKTWREIQSTKKLYRKFSKATISRHMTKRIGDNTIDKRSNNKGRPKKISDRDRRNILRQVEVLRSQGRVNFTVKRVKSMAGLSSTVCDETIRLVMKSDGLTLRNAAKKGVLTKADLTKRLKFAKRVVREFENSGRELWKTGISFYLDGASFTHKYNPQDQAQAPKKKIWGRTAERLNYGMTAKSNHEGVGGKQAHFLVGIGYQKGVVFCEQYDGRLNGEKFAEFVRTKLPDAFERSTNPRGKCFLQDGDPSQNSKKAYEALVSIGASKFSIPPRSPDLNPIENIFHIVKNRLSEDALEQGISFENWAQFTTRVKQTIESTDGALIDKTIASMEKRINLVIKNKGERTKY